MTVYLSFLKTRKKKSLEEAAMSCMGLPVIQVASVVHAAM